MTIVFCSGHAMSHLESVVNIGSRMTLWLGSCVILHSFLKEWMDVLARTAALVFSPECGREEFCTSYMWLSRTPRPIVLFIFLWHENFLSINVPHPTLRSYLWLASIFYVGWLFFSVSPWMPDLNTVCVLIPSKYVQLAAQSAAEASPPANHHFTMSVPSLIFGPCLSSTLCIQANIQYGLSLHSHICNQTKQRWGTGSDLI